MLTSMRCNGSPDRPLQEAPDTWIQRAKSWGSTTACVRWIQLYLMWSRSNTRYLGIVMGARVTPKYQAHVNALRTHNDGVQPAT